MIVLFTLLFLFVTRTVAQSSELIYTGSVCSLEERVSVTNTAPSVSECETACFNRYLVFGDCFYYSYYSSEVLCEMFETCNTIVVEGQATTYSMTNLPPAPTLSPTSFPTLSPTPECVCLNGGVCVNNLCACEYPYYGVQCENQKECSLC